VTASAMKPGTLVRVCEHKNSPNSTHPHDAPLSDAGETQANDVAERLAFTKPHMMASSPFQRAIMCLEPLARRLKQKMCVEPGLCEFLCSQTRTKVPGFIAEAVTVTPYVSTKYQPFWPNLKLETWEEVIVLAAIAPDYDK